MWPLLTTTGSCLASFGDAPEPGSAEPIALRWGLGFGTRTGSLRYEERNEENDRRPTARFAEESAAQSHARRPVGRKDLPGHRTGAQGESPWLGLREVLCQ